MVPNVRTSLLSAPPELATSRQATTVRLFDSATPRMYSVHGAILSLPTGTIRVDGGRGSAR